MLTVGIKGTMSITVTEKDLATVHGSGTLPVYATPAMIALMEGTAAASVQPELEDGQTTVGTLLNIKHLSATPAGAHVHCESTLTEVDRRRLVFAVKAYDEAGLIGEGIHERFIVESGRFMEKANNKLVRAE